MSKPDAEAAIGEALIDTIIQGRLVRDDEQESAVKVWAANAPEQLGAAAVRLCDANVEQEIIERDAANDAIQRIHVALGGDGEWVYRTPPVAPPHSGDLGQDALALAKTIRKAAYAAGARDAAGVVANKHAELAKRSYPPPTILKELEAAILALLDAEGGDDE